MADAPAGREPRMSTRTRTTTRTTATTRTTTARIARGAATLATLGAFAATLCGSPFPRGRFANVGVASARPKAAAPRDGGPQLLALGVSSYEDMEYATAIALLDEAL